MVVLLSAGVSVVKDLTRDVVSPAFLAPVEIGAPFGLFTSIQTGCMVVN